MLAMAAYSIFILEEASSFYSHMANTVYRLFLNGIVIDWPEHRK
jgi:hypothetical protein